jgi:predicted transcriptional regulator
VRIFIRTKSNKIAANLKEVPHVSLPAKTIYGLLKKLKKKFLVKGKTSENTALYSLKKRL